MDWFTVDKDSPEWEAIDEMLIHEYGHDAEPNHLSDDYYRALCGLGAKMRTFKAPKWSE